MLKSLRVVVMLMMVTLLLVASVASAQGRKVIVTAQEMGPDDIPTLDPAVASDVPSVQLAVLLFPEVARANEETAELEFGIGTWSYNDDQSVFTVSISDQLTWVKYNPATDAVEQVLGADGNPLKVTANDVAFTLSRIGEDYLGVYEAFVSEVKVVDDFTLEFTAVNPGLTFLNVLGMWFTSATPQVVIEEVGDTWIEPENIVTYGPFAVKSWIHGESITIVKNPFFEGVNAIPAAKVDEVVFRFLDEETQTAAFEAGELDASEISASQYARIKADPVLSASLREGLGTCTYYYGFNVRKAPFDDPRAVLAFSKTIDRELITEAVTQRGERPAGFFTLPTLAAAPRQEDFPDYAVLTDVEGGQALWAEYLADTGKTNSDFALTILHNNSSLHAAVAQAIQQMWKEALGVEVNIATQDFGTYLQQRKDADIFRAAWCKDYSDTNNFLFDVFHSSVNPDTGFNNAEYDALVLEAARTADEATRVALYAEAERLLVRDAATIAPIYYYVAHSLTSDRIERTHSVIGREYYEKWDVKG